MRRIVPALVVAALSVLSIRAQQPPQAGREPAWAFTAINGAVPAEEPGSKSLQGSTRTYTLYLFRGSSASPGGVAYPNQSAGKLAVPTGQSGEWGASWIVSPPAPGLGTNNAIRVQLAADTNHVVQFQGCKFRIERLES